MRKSMQYTNENRGKIQFRERKKQIIDFSGLKYDNITPSDIDGYIEYRNIASILYEFKYKNAELSDGQLKSLIRNTDKVAKCGCDAVLFICRHEVDDPNEDVDAASTPVDEYYYNKTWYPANGRTAKEMTDAFMDYVKKKRNFMQ